MCRTREQNKNLRETIQRLRRFGLHYHILIGASSSAEVVGLVRDGSLDFVYLDADHKYALVRADLAAWYPKVRPGGVVSGHDYLDSPNCCGSEFGVKTAVREFCGTIGVTELFVCQTEPFPNWHFVKPNGMGGAQGTERPTVGREGEVV